MLLNTFLFEFFVIKVYTINNFVIVWINFWWSRSYNSRWWNLGQAFGVTFQIEYQILEWGFKHFMVAATATPKVGSTYSKIFNTKEIFLRWGGGVVFMISYFIFYWPTHPRDYSLKWTSNFCYLITLSHFCN